MLKHRLGYFFWVAVMADDDGSIALAILGNALKGYNKRKRDEELKKLTLEIWQSFMNDVIENKKTYLDALIDFIKWLKAEIEKK